MKSSGESILSFDIINSIFSYLYDNTNILELKIKGIPDVVYLTLYSIPHSLNNEKCRAEMKKVGFENGYELLNELYKKLDINVLSEEDMESGVEYFYLHFEFYSKHEAKAAGNSKNVLNHFIMLFCSTNNADDFKMLHTTNSLLNYTKGLLSTKYLDYNNPKGKAQEKAIRDLKIVLHGICQYLKIKIPRNGEFTSVESLLKTDEINIKTFEEFVKLVSRRKINEEELKKQSKKLFKNFKEEDEDKEIDGHFDFFESINAWNSDWKFDPEDAEYFISEMIGEDFKFDYPEETYSHDLFPYIQSELEKSNLELLTYETYGDSYLFFVVNKDEVERILELSDRTKIEVTQL